MKYKSVHLFIGAVIALVTIAVLAGLFISGSPLKERVRRLDAQRVNDLQQLSFTINQYYNTHGSVLPVNFDQLRQDPQLYVNSTKDPESGTAYQYRANTSSTYDLCANFQTDYMAPTSRIPQAYPVDAVGTDFWNHPIGEHCFTLNVPQQDQKLPMAPTLK